MYPSATRALPPRGGGPRSQLFGLAVGHTLWGLAPLLGVVVTLWGSMGPHSALGIRSGPANQARLGQRVAQEGGILLPEAQCGD